MGESRAQEHDARARVRMGGPARERASKSCREREAERVGPRAGARGRERESSVFVYFMHRALSGQAMVVLVGTCSISVKQRGVFYIWYICSSKPLSLVLCSYVSLFLRVCVMMGARFIYLYLIHCRWLSLEVCMPCLWRSS